MSTLSKINLHKQHLDMLDQTSRCCDLIKWAYKINFHNNFYFSLCECYFLIKRRGSKFGVLLWDWMGMFNRGREKDFWSVLRSPLRLECLNYHKTKFLYSGIIYRNIKKCGVANYQQLKWPMCGKILQGCRRKTHGERELDILAVQVT
jgi:hypothetical protein